MDMVLSDIDVTVEKLVFTVTVVSISNWGYFEHLASIWITFQMIDSLAISKLPCQQVMHTSHWKYVLFLLYLLNLPLQLESFLAKTQFYYLLHTYSPIYQLYET